MWARPSLGPRRIQAELMRLHALKLATLLFGGFSTATAWADLEVVALLDNRSLTAATYDASTKRLRFVG